jgi:hypothetical protein
MTTDTRKEVEMSKKAVLSLMAILAVLGVFVGRAVFAGHPAVAAVTTSMVINAPAGAYFDPPPAGVQPALSASQAIAKFQSVNPAFSPPTDATVQLGLYSSVSYDNSLAWGISYKECQASSFGPYMKPFKDPNASCTFWVFLDANTGEMLEALNQHS